MTSELPERPSVAEALVLWAMYGFFALAVAVTYARIPPGDTYNVSEDGLDGGLGRALVYLNFPVALAAIALVVPAIERLRARWADAAGVVAIALCLVVSAPGVVEQDDLDAKPANAVPALGVALALALALAAARGRGFGRPLPFAGLGDWIRLALAAVLVLASIPWIAAELGFYVTGAPGLGDVFEAGRVVPEPEHPDIRAVHLGRHHGTDGVLLALTALGLSRELGRIGRRRLRLAFAAWLSLMLVYGLANALQDFWLEQLVKRGATTLRLPSMLRPDTGAEWLALLLAAAAVYALLSRSSSPQPARQ